MKISSVSSCRGRGDKLPGHFRFVNIALVNELKVTARWVHLEVIEAAKTSRLAGVLSVGVGRALHRSIRLSNGRRANLAHRAIELAGEINTAMPDHVVRVAVEALNDEGKAVKGSRVLILGLAYKANVDDDRESPSYKLIQRFEALGATVAYHDPFVPVIPRTREHGEYAGRKSVPAITPDYDLIVLSTGHDVYRDFNFSTFPMPLVDTRNCVRQRPAKYLKA